jgi:hypothetical protein
MINPYRNTTSPIMPPAQAAFGVIMVLFFVLLIAAQLERRQPAAMQMLIEASAQSLLPLGMNASGEMASPFSTK